MRKKSNLCRKLAKILDSDILTNERNLCVVTRKRNINVQIKGRPTRSPLVINALFSFESKDSNENTLNLGETVILQEEINPFISALRTQGIKVTSLHNNWLFENPRLFYINFLSIENPLVFAKKVAAAFTLLEDDDRKKTNCCNDKEDYFSKSSCFESKREDFNHLSFLDYANDDYDYEEDTFVEKPYTEDNKDYFMKKHDRFDKKAHSKKSCDYEPVFTRPMYFKGKCYFY